MPQRTESMCDIKSGGDTFNLNVPEELRPSIERKLTGTTKLDSKIDDLPIPVKPKLSVIAIRLIRWYQKSLSPKLGNRCVFEPSCSHYCELSIRKFGLIKGVLLTVSRLHRCRPGNGGVNMPTTKGV